MKKSTKVSLRWKTLMGFIQYTEFQIDKAKGIIELRQDDSVKGWVMNVEMKKKLHTCERIFDDVERAKKYAPKYIKKLATS